MSDDLEAVVFDDAGERITSEHPEWAAVCEYRKQQTIRQDPASVRRRLMLDLRRDIRTTFDAVMGEVDDLDHRERAEEALADVLSGQVDPRFEHIATWWDQYAPRKRTPGGLAVVRAKVAVPRGRRRDRDLDLEQAVQVTINLIGQGFHQPTEQEVWDAVADIEVMQWTAIRSRWRRAAGRPITIGEVREIAKKRAPLLHLSWTQSGAVQ